MNSRDALLLSGLALIMLVGPIGTLWAIGEGMPAYVGGKGNPDDVAGEWISKGTALSAPLVVLTALAAGLGLSRGSGRWAKTGVALVMLTSALIAGAITGEPLLPAEADGGDIALILFRLAVYGSVLAVLLFGARSWREAPV